MRPRARVLVGVVLGVIGLTSLLSLQNWLALAQAGREESWSRLWLGELPLWIGWALGLPLISRLVARSSERRWPSTLALHILAATCLHLLVHVFVVLTREWIHPHGEALELLRFVWLRGFGTSLIVYLGIAATLHAWAQGKAARERAVQASVLTSELARARLGQLEAQLRPHFLFNALNTASAWMQRDPTIARAVLTDLAELLRRSLSDEHEHPIALARELELCRRYLAIQRLRFGERLSVIETVDPAASERLVPPLMVQPLIENAIVHGLADRSDLTLRICAKLDFTGALLLEITDDGPGMSAIDRARLSAPLERARIDVLLPTAAPDPARGHGLGLRGLRARLALLAPRGTALRLLDAQPGLRVQLHLPNDDHADSHVDHR